MQNMYMLRISVAIGHGEIVPRDIGDCNRPEAQSRCTALPRKGCLRTFSSLCLFGSSRIFVRIPSPSSRRYLGCFHDARTQDLDCLLYHG